MKRLGAYSHAGDVEKKFQGWFYECRNEDCDNFQRWLSTDKQGKLKEN